jgi:hypothetical protein
MPRYPVTFNTDTGELCYDPTQPIQGAPSGSRPGGGELVSRGLARTIADSRELNLRDDGAAFEVAAGAIVTVPLGLPSTFACCLMPMTGRIAVACRGGVTVNGGTAMLTRDPATLVNYSIFLYATGLNTFTLTGS